MAIHRKPHTVLRRFAVLNCTVFSGAPCLKLSVNGYKKQGGLAPPPQYHRHNPDAVRRVCGDAASTHTVKTGNPCVPAAHTMMPLVWWNKFEITLYGVFVQ